MIKINLLPIKQDRRREAGRNQVIIGALALVLEIVIFVVLHTSAVARINEQKNRNNRVKNEVEILQKEVKNHQNILNEIAEFEKRQAAIDELLAARQGPVYVLLELSNIMSKRGRPHLDQDAYQEMIRIDPAAGYDENWDFRRVWISRFKEKDRRVRISGDALTHEDVAEFLRRINLSSFFTASELISTSLTKPKIKLPDTKKLGETTPVVHFEFRGEIKYR